jgi:hypothetical protein
VLYYRLVATRSQSPLKQLTTSFLLLNASFPPSLLQTPSARIVVTWSEVLEGIRPNAVLLFAFRLQEQTLPLPAKCEGKRQLLPAPSLRYCSIVVSRQAATERATSLSKKKDRETAERRRVACEEEEAVLFPMRRNVDGDLRTV